MGRDTTGAVTTGGCLQVNIKAFTKHIKEGISFIQGTINYSCGASIGVDLRNVNDEYQVKLLYNKTVEGEKELINYTVRLEGVASNLGKGEIYYFICPFTFQRCKVLYMAYGSLYFKSRKAYRTRIYYSSQLHSNSWKYNSKYWDVNRKLEKLYPKHPKTHYKGLQTRPQKRIERLEQKMDHYDEVRYAFLAMALKKMGVQF